MALIDKIQDKQPRLSNETDSKSGSVSHNQGVSFSKDEIELIMYLIQEFYMDRNILKNLCLKLE